MNIEKQHMNYFVFLILLVSLMLYKSFFWGSQNVFTSSLIPQVYNREYFINKLQETSFVALGSDILQDYQIACHQNNKSCLLIPYQQLMGDVIWLQTIQSVGANIFAGYYSGLDYALDIVTTFSPYREYPYIFGQLIIPSLQGLEIDPKIQQNSWQQALKLGEKGLFFLCDSGSISLVNDLSEEGMISAYRDGVTLCRDVVLPQSVAFTSFYYLHDYTKSLQYYKIAALSSGATTFHLNMPALVAGRLGYHLKSATMWYQKSLDEINIDQQQYFWNKGVYELTLDILTQADVSGCLQDIVCLQNQGYLQQEISKRISRCAYLETYEISNQAQCDLLAYAFKNKFIDVYGNLVYPLDTGFIYVWRLDNQDWGIIETR